MSKPHIYVVEDEEDILELLRFHLLNQDFEVSTALSGEEAVREIPEKSPDLVLLDLMLPGQDGLEVCRALKGDPKTVGIPVIMLTAKGEESDIVKGLELGADDYVTKPFGIKVLIARLKAALRRRTSPVPDADTVLRIHEFVIDPHRRQVTVAGDPVDLTYTEFALLQFLAGRPGRVMTRDQIIDAVRGENYAVTDRAVDVQIVGLRKKLGNGAKYIETVRGVGYRLKEANA